LIAVTYSQMHVIASYARTGDRRSLSVACRSRGLLQYSSQGGVMLPSVPHWKSTALFFRVFATVFILVVEVSRPRPRPFSELSVSPPFSVDTFSGFNSIGLCLSNVDQLCDTLRCLDRACCPASTFVSLSWTLAIIFISEY